MKLGVVGSSLQSNLRHKNLSRPQLFARKRHLAFHCNGLAGADMFAVGLRDVFHRRILIVESDATIAETLVQFVWDNGGEVVGCAACVQEAISIAGSTPDLDSVLVDAELDDGLALPLVRQLKRHEVHTIWVIGHDGYFVPQNETDPPAVVYRLAGDPDDVVRVSTAH